MPRVKKTTKISDGLEGVAVKEELVGAFVGWREHCSAFLIGDATFSLQRVGQNRWLTKVQGSGILYHGL